MALEAFEKAPLCIELSMPSSMRWVLEEAILRYVGYGDEDNEDGSDPLECPCFLYELVEAKFETCFGNVVGQYKEKNLRDAKGIKPYWLLWSY